MKLFYITFRSVTYAQRGEQVLSRSGVRCGIQRTPRWMEAQGCGYALKVWAKEITDAMALLRAANVPLRRVYFQQVDGNLEEIPV